MKETEDKKMIVFNAKLIITGKSEVLAYFIFASSRTKDNLPIAFGIHSIQ